MRQLRRLQRTKGYLRKTDDKHGREIVKPFIKSDFDEMVRCCLNHRDKHNPESWRYRVWYRNYILLILGVNTGNRIETLIELTPRDIAGGQYTCKEMKTGKVQQFNMNADVYATVREYIERYNIQMNEYIFESRQGLKGYPITRQQAWRVIKQLAKEAGIE